jgi:hypothetical protein
MALNGVQLFDLLSPTFSTNFEKIKIDSKIATE